MAIEDLISKHHIQPTGHAPSRVRSMLQTVGNQLQAQRSAGRIFGFVGGKTGDTSQLLAQVAEALGEWRRLEELLTEEREQRQRIANRISAFVEFYTVVRRQLRAFEGKRRRPLTTPEKVVAVAKRRETRRLRGTMGKKQKKNIKA